MPSIQEPDSVYTMLMQLTIPDISRGVFHPCVRIARRQFSADDWGSTSSKRLSVERQKLSPNKFQTMRWRRWGFHDPYHPTLAGKTIIDLHRLRLPDVVQEESNGDPHNPRVNCVDTSTTILFRSDISISNLLLGKSKVINEIIN